MQERTPSKPGNILKRAILNQYNYIFLGGAGLFTLATGSWLPAILALGAEVLWVVLGADSATFRRWVEKQETREAKQRLLAEVVALASTLESPYAERFEALRKQSDEIQGLARENQGLASTLLQDEMAKLGQLLHSFLRMAASHQRLGRYLTQNPVGEIERDIAKGQRALRQEEDPRVQSSHKQALALAQKRLKQNQQIEGAWKSLEVQMETLEKSFDYLKSHILGIGTREELAQELDNLVNGVSTVSELESSTSELMEDLKVQASAKVINLKG